MNKYNDIQGIELLQFNHAGVIQLKDGSSMNYGVIRKNETELVCYTGKGLREMWKPAMTEEEKIIANKLRKIANEEGGEKKLIESEHIAVIPINQILRVIF